MYTYKEWLAFLNVADKGLAVGVVLLNGSG